jgi:DNA-binding Lrp family transcriptional regulator
MPLDDADIGILNVLRRDARITNQELAAKVGLSPSACSRRIQRLQQSEEFLEAFERAVRNSPGMRDGTIAECYLLSGRYDYMMRVAMRDMADYETFHKEQHSRLPGVARVETSFAMRNVAP